MRGEVDADFVGPATTKSNAAELATTINGARIAAEADARAIAEERKAVDRNGSAIKAASIRRLDVTLLCRVAAAAIAGEAVLA
jgi:hypothetical protein